MSLVAFGHATQEATLDGQPTKIIHADLTPGGADGSMTNLTTAQRLAQNTATCFEGIKK